MNKSFQVNRSISGRTRGYRIWCVHRKFGRGVHKARFHDSGANTPPPDAPNYAQAVIFIHVVI